MAAFTLDTSTVPTSEAELNAILIRIDKVIAQICDPAVPASAIPWKEFGMAGHESDPASALVALMKVREMYAKARVASQNEDPYVKISEFQQLSQCPCDPIETRECE